jgi:prolipoprotein diacylglyceryl transferase
VTALLGAIPSPDTGTIDFGPFSVHLYGLMLLVAIGLCILITGRRYVARGGDWDLIFRCALWGVTAGIVGARLYHVITSWDEVPDAWWGRLAIWKGGRGVRGGVATGCLDGGLVARRAGADVWLLADCLAPGLLVAQGVGRLGNWWNQELFGKPTDLPWGLEIDPSNRPAQYLDQATFHPTFLYELLWDFAAALALVLVERRFRIRPSGVFALYLALYGFGRFFVELLRVDPAHHLDGVRLNAYVSALVCIAGIVWFVLVMRRGRGRAAPPRRPTMSVPQGRRVRGRS